MLKDTASGNNIPSHLKAYVYVYIHSIRKLVSYSLFTSNFVYFKIV